MMKKGKYLFSVVGFLIVAGLVEAVSGFILWFALPSGGGRKGLDLTYLGLTRHTWIDIHDWVAIALTAIVIIHLIVHWKWVTYMFRQVFTKYTQLQPSIQESEKEGGK
jgi:uncharacterized iron-regulated membrane protein